MMVAKCVLIHFSSLSQSVRFFDCNFFKRVNRVSTCKQIYIDNINNFSIGVFRMLDEIYEY